MPINDARVPARSSLTREQQRQQEAAIYGLDPSLMSPNTPQFTHEELERMRAILAQHDQSGNGKIREFDLNNPPKERYVHQEFPRLVYNHASRKHKPAHTQAELDTHLAAGWSKEPFPAEAEEPELSAEDAAEAAEVDAQLKKKKRA